SARYRRSSHEIAYSPERRRDLKTVTGASLGGSEGRLGMKRYLFLLAGVWAGCAAGELASDSSGTVVGPACQPNTSQACACDAGPSGTQTCAADGSSWGPCECQGGSLDDAADSGMSEQEDTGAPDAPPDAPPPDKPDAAAECGNHMCEQGETC